MAIIGQIAIMLAKVALLAVLVDVFWSIFNLQVAPGLETAKSGIQAVWQILGGAVTPTSGPTKVIYCALSLLGVQQCLSLLFSAVGVRIIWRTLIMVLTWLFG